MSLKTIQVPIEYQPLFKEGWREAAIYGGRFSLKSHTVARYLLIQARLKKTRILCCREFQNSIADSSHQLLADLIKMYELNDFSVTNNAIVNKINGSDFLFKGLHNNEQSIKSTEAIDIAWVEEAQTVSASSLEILTPTVRKDGSRLIYTYNRLLEDDPVHQRLVIEGRPNTLILNVNYDIALKYGMMPDVIRLEMEDDKEKRPALYKHKWLGEPYGIERKIYKDWAFIDEIPHEARLERYGLDFGYTCLKGDTIVPTITGNKRIDEIIEGEYVLTRKGYKRVVWSGSRGIKQVYGVDFGLDKRIIVTGDHRIFTADGWKEVKDLSSKETICELKQSLMEKFIGVIQKESIRTISILKERLTERLSRVFYTEIFTNIITEKYQKDIVFTTSTKTHSTIVQKTLLQCLIANTTKYIFQTILGKLKKQKCKKSEVGCVSQKTIGWSDEKNRLLPPEIVLKNAQNVVRKLLQQTPTRSFAEQYAERKPTQETAKKNILASFVVRFLQLLHISKGTPALRSVQISSHPLKEKVEVFDLTVEDEHEFFANGVLVHNCDPTAIIALYRYNGGFILDEVCYQKGLSNRQIADVLNGLPKAMVIADSAEPKSIDEIRLFGINIMPCQKGQGSINQGIQFVQDQRISVTKRSKNLINEYNRYMWKEDNSGRIINIPDGGFDHACDAVRYSLDGYKQSTPIFNGLAQKSTFR